VADTRRKRRRLSEIGEIRHVVATTPKEAEEALDAMIARKVRRFAETGAPNVFAHSGFRAFYASLCHAPPGEMRARASRLMVGEETVAAHGGLTHRGRFYHLMIGWSGGEWAC
jgi:CelD/BcsL family acetyltransferase involved in cellulose biosynthesis